MKRSSDGGVRRPKMDDDRIISIIEYGIGQSVGFAESKLSVERERVQFYYDGERPHKQGPGDSGYNSRDVFVGVEDMKCQLLDTFAANKRPVQFDPVQGEPAEIAKQRTDYVSHVLFNQNAGFQLFQETIHEGLMARNSVVKVWWEKMVKNEYVHLSATSAQELQAYLVKHSEEQPEITDLELHEDGVTIKRVTIRLKRDVSQVRCRLLPPEEFGISPMAESIKDADLVFHRTQMTHSDLIKAGYDPKIVADLHSQDKLWMAMEPEKISRFFETDDLIGTTFEEGQQSRKTVMVYECYLELDLDDDGDGGSGVSQLFKVTKVGNTILDKEPVERKPFIAFCPLPRPKAFWGTNFAKLLEGTQSARSYLTRAIVRHTLTTTNPRYQVVKGTLQNPKELLDNRFAGVVNVNRPDGIMPLEQQSLNPFVFQTIQMLKSDKEEKIGISDLSQGLDKDAVSKQNSGDMIHELITVSQLRQKIVARNFAENFLRDLYREIYLLVLENEDRQKMIQVSGGWQPLDFSQWPEECSVSVSFSLGYGEQEKEAMMWANIHKSLSSMPALAPNYGPPQQYMVARRGLEAAGIADIDSVLAPMDKVTPPPPNALQQAEIAMKQADAKVKEANAQAALQNIQLEQQKLAQAHQLEMARIQLETLKVQTDIQLKQDQLAHKVAVDAAEIALQKDAQANDKLMAEAQPTH